VSITGKTRLAAVLGWPVEHSLSPQIMNAAFATAGVDAVLVPIGVPPESLATVVAGLRAQRMVGASVTLPHKLDVMLLCDEVSTAAREIGAVNCLQLVGDRLVGHNTDAPGFVAGLSNAGFVASGKRAVILGAGGSARAVSYGLRGEGCQVEVIARKPAEVRWSQASPWTPESLRAAFARADVIVDCTPLGLGDSDEQAWVDALPLDALRPEAWVATLVYHRVTSLLDHARSRGHSTLDGRAMLVHQAARAFELWTGRTAPVPAMTHALDASLSGT